MADAHHLLLFDGVCGLCNRVVDYALAKDKAGRICFAPIQSKTASTVLAELGAEGEGLDTVHLVVDRWGPSPRLLERSDAVLAVLEVLGWPKIVVMMLRWVPRSLRDWVYRRVENHRYRFFGKMEQCRIPTDEEQQRFLS